MGQLIRGGGVVARALVAVALVGVPARAATVVFRDGFETGSICAWSGGGCPAPVTVDGVWLVGLDFGGQPRQLAVLLHQRADASLVGYVIGGTPRRVVTSGSYLSGFLNLDLVLERPDGDRSVHLAASVAGDLATGSATGDLGPQTIHLVRWPDRVEERRWVVVDPTGAGRAAHLAAAMTPAGELLSGGFSATSSSPACLWACDGGLTWFSEVGDTVSFGLETDGGCSAGSAGSATFDPASGLWVGSATFTDCSGTTTGPIIAAPTTAARSDEAAQVLAAVAGVADQLEAGTAFTAPHPSFAADFLHEGRDLATTLADLDAELAAWDDIEVGLARVRRISTVEVSGGPPELHRPLGVELEESRSGLPVGGGPRELYLDPAANPFDDVYANPLAVAGPTPDGWRLVGDHQPAFDLPFVAGPVGPGDTTLTVATAGGPVYVALGPYGSHFEPLTGHAFGDGKPNLVGFFVADDSGLAELIGDGIGNDDGACDPGEACAYWGGLDGSLVRNRIPTYVAPHAGEITALTLEEGPAGVYFDDVPKWELRVRFPSQVEYRLGHVGAIAPAVADAVAAETGCDPRTWDTCGGVGPGTDLLADAAPIPVAAGAALCQPQVLADPVPGYPGYFVGGGTFLDYPWAQMEFFTDLPVDLGTDEGCPFLALPRARAAELRGVMERDMLDPESLRYRDRSFTERWEWTAEAVLCTAPSHAPRDFSSLLTNLGGWYERSGAGTTPDEIVSFVQMFPDSPVYDSANYDPATQLLVLRGRQLNAPFSWTMPDLSVLEVYYPTGELRELDGDSFLVAWRGLGWTAGDPPAYQRAAYRLDQDGLTIRWGALAADPASAAQPVLGAADPCDEVDVLCYSHQFLTGF